MPVCQVEQYYIAIVNNEKLKDRKEAIESMLSHKGLPDYEFFQDDKTLVINGFYDEDEAEQVEDEIIGLLN